MNKYEWSRRCDKACSRVTRIRQTPRENRASQPQDTWRGTSPTMYPNEDPPTLVFTGHTRLHREQWNLTCHRGSKAVWTSAGHSAANSIGLVSTGRKRVSLLMVVKSGGAWPVLSPCCLHLRHRFLSRPLPGPPSPGPQEVFHSLKSSGFVSTMLS